METKPTTQELYDKLIFPAEEIFNYKEEAFSDKLNQDGVFKKDNKFFKALDSTQVNKITNKFYNSKYIEESTGIWDINTGPSVTATNTHQLHKYDQGLFNPLLNFLQDQKTIVDFGCGNADYARHLIEKGNKTVDCYDGNPNTPEMTGGLGKVLDLSKKFDLGKKYECVISLEVGEHIPPKFEQIYIDNLDRHCSQCIILSWALPGQGGAGHVNERDNSYIKNEFQKRGYKSWDKAENLFRNAATFSWFKNTMMVFIKE